MRLADGKSWQGVSANHKQISKRARPTLKAALISLPHEREVSGRAGDAVVPSHPEPTGQGYSAVESGHEQCTVQRVAQQLCVRAVQTYRKERFEQPQESPF